MSRPHLQIFLALVVFPALLISCSDDSPAAPTPTPCEYSFVPASASFEATGGDATVQVVTSDSCDWTISSTVPWITLPSGNTSRGSATAFYRVTANPDEVARSGALRIGNYVFSIAQSGRTACTYEVAPTERVFEFDGGAGTVTVSTQVDCGWTAVSDASWLTITQGTQGIGPGDVTYVVARNDGEVRRAAVMTIAGRPISVSQDPAPGPVLPCEYVVTPVDVRLHWHQTGGQFTLSTQPQCTWTAAVGEPWLSLTTPAQGSGSLLMAFGNSIYTGQSPRRAPIQVRWPTETAGQNVWVTQEGCWYALAPDVRDIGVNGGTSQTTVLASPASVDCNVGCPWTAVSLVPWIEVTSSMPKAGDEMLFFRVNPNTTGEPRIGQIRIEHMFLTIRQAGQ